MHPALNTVLCQRLGARVPIFGFAHSLEVVAAVSKAGGVGIWGATRNTPDEIRDGLGWLSAQLGDLPFGIDLVLPRGMPSTDDRAVMEAQIPAEHRAFVDGLRDKYEVPDDGLPGVRSRFVRSEEMAGHQFAAIMESSVPVFAAGVGSPPEKVAQAKAAGKTVISLVGAPKHAKYALAAGADILVAQGYEAGAHTGDIGTYALVPQIVDIAGDVPVIVAGGVATGAHIAGALALGGVGVWMGTAWLFTREQNIDPIILAKLAAAGISRHDPFEG